MNFFEKIDKHTKLMNDMSDRVGTDWRDLMIENPELVREYRNAVMTCTQCKKDGECQGWMGAHDSATSTPEYCLNKDLIENLAKA